jgi:hypothetical protein
MLEYALTAGGLIDLASESRIDLYLPFHLAPPWGGGRS